MLIAALAPLSAAALRAQDAPQAGGVPWSPPYGTQPQAPPPLLNGPMPPAQELPAPRYPQVAPAPTQSFDLPTPSQVAPPPTGGSLAGPGELVPPEPSQMQNVADVRIRGNDAIPATKVVSYIRTRAGRPLDLTVVTSDIHALNRSRLFANVDVTYERADNGVVVIFNVVERPTIRYIKYVGNQVRDSSVAKQTNLKVGDAMDPYTVEEARRALEEWYHSKGYSKARVKLIEGDQSGDRGVVMLINEGAKQRIFRIEFEGNSDEIAPDGSLRTKIQSKKPWFFFIKGEVDRAKIEEDKDRLTAYYRSLGFFQCRVGYDMVFNKDQNWLTLIFVINEGVRSKIRNVSVLGNTRFETSDIKDDLELLPGEFFDQSKLDSDVGMIRDKYGEIGYVFCDVQADPRLMEEPGYADLMYRIEEGDRYKIGRVTVRVGGDDPHTRHNVVLNRLSFRPGDIANTKQFRASERRLKYAGIFQNTPAQGVEPKVTFSPPEEDPDETGIANRPNGGVRGQSPDDYAPAYGGSSVGQLAPGGGWSGYIPSAGGAAGPASFGDLPPSNGPPIGTRPRGMTSSGDNSPPSSTDGVSSAAPVSSPSSTSNVGPIHYDSQVVSAYGQVPMGRTDPYATNTIYNATSASGGGVVPAQYTDVMPTTPVLPPAISRPPAQTVSPYSAPQVYPQAPSYAPSTTGPAPVYEPIFAAPAVPQAQPPNMPGNFAPPGSFIDPNAAPAPAPGSGYVSPSELFPNGMPPIMEDQPRDLDIFVDVNETQTGRFMVGVGVNSDAGVVGSVIIDEQNFDWRRPPSSWEDVRNFTAFRGGGQQFRIEAVPGNQVSRYTFTFREPYLFDTPVSFGLSGYYFQRFYRNWTEERLGGRMELGYQFRPDLSGAIGLRAENVGISNPTIPSPPALAEVIGDNALYVIDAHLAHDTRDSTFMATEGHLIRLGYSQGLGDFTFPQGTIEGRQYFLLKERPDRSGRHTLSISSLVGFSGSNTPLYERFYAGGFSTLRGFNFRGASPLDLNVEVGGDFEFINSVEYMFPITADDMLRGVVFCDFGTVEQNITITGENFRVSPGVGLRLNVPALGPAPIALDFAVPVHHAPGDNIQNVSFFLGLAR